MKHFMYFHCYPRHTTNGPLCPIKTFKYNLNKIFYPQIPLLASSPPWRLSRIFTEVFSHNQFTKLPTKHHQWSTTPNYKIKNIHNIFFPKFHSCLLLHTLLHHSRLSSTFSAAFPHNLPLPIILFSRIFPEGRRLTKLMVINVFINKLFHSCT